MRYQPLGDSGLQVSVVGLGCNNFGRDSDLEMTRGVVDAAIDAGITLFDTADIYGATRGASEQLLGQVLGKRRDDIVLATKFGMNMEGANGPDWGARGSRRYIRKAIEASLRRLDTDWIDLYQYHQPDGVTPVEETLGALDELIAEGKVRYIGSSNFASWQVVEADFLARDAGANRFISAQNHYSLIQPEAEAELAPACEAYGVGILPFYPLANGLLTGKHRRGEPPVADSRIAKRRTDLHEGADWDLIERLESFAQDSGHTLVELAIAGLAEQPAVSSVIAGARTADQVKANAAAGEWDLTAAEVAELESLRTPPV
ncbi:aryl-alcohol dehydrogenase-like predicted oxidoreductase [Antricoccus suffuscus]|uniref:Aryl-alcohol dehydrogenase-like predicted oxidoreductase n=1 Tax=Antricoccus suffuscus TaxID=1629062 RepID=A0A2T1A4I6_9ACTN|nr:aldo/keto reductase [Antricoccus suffuscus]PRZ43417.1 aryl-alcohol dehydrogenase-like predicted oxidoreductase [Antricoccus suffuscus]